MLRSNGNDAGAAGGDFDQAALHLETLTEEQVKGFNDDCNV